MTMNTASDFDLLLPSDLGNCGYALLSWVPCWHGSYWELSQLLKCKLIKRKIDKAREEACRDSLNLIEKISNVSAQIRVRNLSKYSAKSIFLSVTFTGVKLVYMP